MPSERQRFWWSFLAALRPVGTMEGVVGPLIAWVTPRRKLAAGRRANGAPAAKFSVDFSSLIREGRNSTVLVRSMRFHNLRALAHCVYG